MRLSTKQRIFTNLIAKFICWASSQGYELTLGEAWRPSETQKIYLEQGKTKLQYSKHQDRLAIDFNLYIKIRGRWEYIKNKERYRPLGEFWESLHPQCKWGGRFGIDKHLYDYQVGWDSNHFEIF